MNREEFLKELECKLSYLNYVQGKLSHLNYIKEYDGEQLEQLVTGNICMLEDNIETTKAEIEKFCIDYVNFKKKNKRCGTGRLNGANFYIRKNYENKNNK